MPDNYTLVDCSDLHLGSPNTSIETIEKMVELVASRKNCFLVCKGDAIDAILPSDKRYATCGIDIKNMLMTPKEQADKVIQLFWKIRKNVVAWGFGNHEYKLLNTMDFGRYIADELDVPYGSYCFKLSMMTKGKTPELMHKMYMTHGYGSINSMAKDDIQRLANRRAALKQKLSNSGHGDVVYMSCGHTHQLLVVEPTMEDRLFLTDDGNAIHQHYHVNPAQNLPYIPPDARWYACTGSFMKLYSASGSFAISYGEVAGYAPSEIGWVEVSVVDRKVTDVRKVIG